MSHIHPQQLKTKDACISENWLINMIQHNSIDFNNLEKITKEKIYFFDLKMYVFRRCKNVKDW